MFPLYDKNPTRTFPVFTVGLIFLNALVFFYQLQLGRGLERFVFAYGMVPYEMSHFQDIDPRIGLPVQATLLTSMFLHGGWMHLIGNMLYLWIFGNNIEDYLGHIRFLLFYLVCGILASLTHTCMEPGSKIPAIGASGAISGVLAAYLVLYPRAKIMTLVYFFFFVRIIPIPAVAVLGFWIVLQVVNSSVPEGAQDGVAYFAHIGGFVAGLILILLARK